MRKLKLPSPLSVPVIYWLNTIELNLTVFSLCVFFPLRLLLSAAECLTDGTERSSPKMPFTLLLVFLV